MPDTDPITQTYQAIRGALMSWIGFTAFVKAANVWDMSDKKFVPGMAQKGAPADFAEVALMQGQFILSPFGLNSKVASIRQSYPLVSVSRTLSTTAMNCLKYQMLIALLKAGDNLGLPHVAEWDITGGSDSFNRKEWTQGETRWTTMATINVLMNVSKQQLLAL